MGRILKEGNGCFRPSRSRPFIFFSFRGVELFFFWTGAYVIFDFFHRAERTECFRFALGSIKERRGEGEIAPVPADPSKTTAPWTALVLCFASCLV